MLFRDLLSFVSCLGLSAALFDTTQAQLLFLELGLQSASLMWLYPIASHYKLTVDVA